MLIIKNLNLKVLDNHKETLIKEVNLSLDSSSKSKVALIGENGSGKSTLLKAIYNNLNSCINIQNEKILYLEQTKKFPENQLFGEILEQHIDINSEYYKIDIILDEFSLQEDIVLKPVKHLSGGELLKLQLAELMIQDPTILLLDEPTNHLDQDAKIFLSNFIKNFTGSILLVTHDREFIQNTTNQIWDIDPVTKTLHKFTGTFKDWRIQKANKIQKSNHMHNSIQSEIQSIQSWLTANQSHPKYRFSAIVKTKKQKIEKLKAKLDDIQKYKDKKITLTKNSNLTYKQNLLISYEFIEHPLYGNLKGKIYNQDQILLTGKNGSGKSTLLKYLSNPVNIQSVYPIKNPKTRVNIFHNKELKIFTLSQSSKLPQSKTVYEILVSNNKFNHTKVFQSMADLRLKHLLKHKLSDLSGGEQKRVELAILSAHQPDMILLDEPTNHLDIYTQEQIQNFLKDTQVTFIIASHDNFLIDNLNFKKYIQL